MLRVFKRAFGSNQPPDRVPPMPASVHVPLEPMPTDANRYASIAASGPAPTLQARPPQEHASALLAWLQGPGGRSGTIPATELAAIHRDLCAELDWEAPGWVAVGRELRRLIGTPKEYARHEGRRVCVYRVPPANSRAPNAMAA